MDPISDYEANAAAGGKASRMNLKGVTSTHFKDVPPLEPFPGLVVRPLWVLPNGKWKAIHFEVLPGASHPDLDVHTEGAEAIYVVSGVYGDGATTYPAGSFFYYPVGSSHAPCSAEGCELLIFYPDA